MRDKTWQVVDDNNSVMSSPPLNASIVSAAS